MNLNRVWSSCRFKAPESSLSSVNSMFVGFCISRQPAIDRNGNTGMSFGLKVPVKTHHNTLILSKSSCVVYRRSHPAPFSSNPNSFAAFL